jgi:hypothetical protein
MIDENTARDIQAEVDGENLPEESARVRALIARDPEAAALHRSLTELAETLAAVPLEAPPERSRALIEATAAWRARGAEKKGLVHQPPAEGQGNTHRTHKREGAMKAKYVIGGLVAAGIAGVFFFTAVEFPPKNEEAVGTIGAVKKYRAEQITEGDVVLGTTEASSDWVPYADFVAHSGALGAAATQLDAISGKFDALNAKTFTAEVNAVNSILEAREMQLQASALAFVTLQAKHLDSTVEARAAMVAASNPLEAKQLTRIALQAKDLNAKLEARELDFAAAREALSGLVRDLSASSKLDATTFAASLLEASSRLGAMNKLEAKNVLEGKALEAELNAVSQTLGARDFTVALKVLQARDSYIASAARLSADLAEARTKLGALTSTLGVNSFAALDAKSLAPVSAIASSLNSRASELQQAGLLGMNLQLEAAVRDFDALMGMKSNVELALGARELSTEARTALAGINATLGAKTLDASNRLGMSVQQDLGAMDRSLGARDLVFGAKAVEALGAHAAALNSTLQSRSLQLEAKQLQAMEQQLGAVTRTLQARTPDAQ